MKVHYSQKTYEWATPQEVFDKLNEEFNFTLDPCATKENAKCEKFFTKEDDGLKQSWARERVFVNPPYGRVIADWVKKAYYSDAEVVVMLIPARTDTRWFHDFIYKNERDHEIRFIKGRLKFGGCKDNAPFPNMIVVFRK